MELREAIAAGITHSVMVEGAKWDAVKKHVKDNAGKYAAGAAALAGAGAHKVGMKYSKGYKNKVLDAKEYARKATFPMRDKWTRRGNTTKDVPLVQPNFKSTPSDGRPKLSALGGR